ncbi:oligosaccharide flippase family protein [Pseudomonas oleovorans]|uniref:Oligosaccharide flippase family protein n=1 Tax=Ectopseudomonas oleovorans TaxID=301 RepID=A0AB35L4M2_ECTOL|nr:oligosaccharide flippase family protein [Pseudomonas oleovorans]MCR1829128.1 oligosaccharide flippase family protein [Pseudomonas oleovorans]MDH0569602.1 oligosaccharide flippase family protein [Pseudomonas oleovorans]
MLKPVNKSIMSNSFWLMVVHLLGYIVPVVEMAILGRALGPDGYGFIVVSLSAVLLMSVFVEYGFNLIGAREVARLKPDDPALAVWVGDIFTAKMMLSLLVAFSVAAAFLMGLIERISVEYLPPLVLYFLGLAFSPFWFFHGMNMMLKPVFLNIILRFVSLYALWCFVEAPDDILLALYIMALSGFINAIVTTAWMLCKIKSIFDVKIRIRSAVKIIASGFSAFLYKGSQDFSAAGSVVVLGGVSGDLQAGYYAPVDKLVRSATGLSGPILTALYPHLSVQSKLQAIHKGLLISVAFFLMGVVGSLIFMFAGSWLVELIVGSDFSESSYLISAFALLIPFRMMNQSLGMTILLPVGKELVGARLLVAAAIGVLAIGGYVASHTGAYGMVLTQLILEFFLCISLLLSVYFIRKAAAKTECNT